MPRCNHSPTELALPHSTPHLLPTPFSLPPMPARLLSSSSLQTTFSPVSSKLLPQLHPNVLPCLDDYEHLRRNPRLQFRTREVSTTSKVIWGRYFCMLLGIRPPPLMTEHHCFPASCLLSIAVDVSLFNSHTHLLPLNGRHVQEEFRKPPVFCSFLG